MNKFIKNILSDIELYEHFKSVLTFHSSCIEGSKISEEDNTKLVNNPSQKTISFEMEKYKKDEVIENKNLGDVFDDLIRNYMNDFSIEELKQ
ncbi:hypothetical protein FACS189459_0330 [Bacilli bacterium]|nr:hypothetical protein FACS189459_0330 [Bacilli bacterium]